MVDTNSRGLHEEHKRNILLLSRMSHGILGAGILCSACWLPLPVLQSWRGSSRIPPDLMTLLQEVAPALLLVGIVLTILGVCGEFVVNAGHWKDARKDEERRLSDLSGRTRFTWPKKRRQYSCFPRAVPPDRPRCVLPPRRQ